MSNDNKSLMPIKDIKDTINGVEFKSRLSATLPSHITADRMASVALTAIMGKTEIIQAWSFPAGRASIMQAINRSAQFGVELDGRMAHMIPFWSSQEKCFLVQLLLDYKGLVVLAKRNGVDAKGTLVYAKDQFNYLEDDGTGKTVVTHTFVPFGDRGEIIGCYSRAIEKGKSPDYELMSIDEVEAVRARSRAKDSGPWATDYGEMVKKTVLKRHSKRWDLDPNVREAIAEDYDSPPPFNAPQIVAPVFNDEVDKEEGAGMLPPPPPTTRPARGPRAVRPAPAAVPAKPAEVKIADRIRALCKAKSIEESKLVEELIGLGTFSSDVTNLDAAYLDNPAGMEMVENQFDDIISRI